MHSVRILTALLVVGRSVVSAGAPTCTTDIKITEPTPSIGCSVIDANVEVDESVAGTLSLQGIEKINKDFTIINATKITGISSSILSVGGTLHLRGLELLSSLNMPSLTSVGNVQFIDLPELLTISANNLTTVSDGLTLRDNEKLYDPSFNALNSINGDMVVNNNNALEVIDGFSRLETVGNILMGGVFKNINLPSLSDVQGSVVIRSTTDISRSCKFFDDLKSNGGIRGKESCISNHNPQ